MCLMQNTAPVFVSPLTPSLPTFVRFANHSGYKSRPWITILGELLRKGRFLVLWNVKRRTDVVVSSHQPECLGGKGSVGRAHSMKKYGNNLIPQGHFWRNTVIEVKLNFEVTWYFFFDIMTLAVQISRGTGSVSIPESLIDSLVAYI